MQVVVRRSDLSSQNPMVLASYADELVVHVTALGFTAQEATVLLVPATAIAYKDRGPLMTGRRTPPGQHAGASSGCLPATHSATLTPT